MAGTSTAVANVVTNFQAKVRREYVREGKFGPYIGATENAIIQTNKDLKKISIPLVGKLKGGGVIGSGTLRGNEEALSNYAATLQPTHYRHGVLVDNEENEKPQFDLFSEARPALMNWMMEKKRDQIIQALGAVEASGTYYNYGGGVGTGATGATAASAGNLDTWQAANSDRILYGAAIVNLTSGNHTTSLGTVDTTTDRLSPSMISLMKRMAENANPLIRPVMVKNDEPWYVLFVGSYSFRDLSQNSTMTQANREARQRGMDNPLFTGEDLIWDGVIIKKIPDIDKFTDSSSGGAYDGIWGAGASGDSLANTGDNTSRVGIGFFCGAQAVGFGIGKMAQFDRAKEDDYGFQQGVAVTAKHDIKKLFYNGKQHGMLTSFHSAPRDA